MDRSRGICRRTIPSADPEDKIVSKSLAFGAILEIFSFFCGHLWLTAPMGSCLPAGKMIFQRQVFDMPQAAFAIARAQIARSMRRYRDDERGAMAFFMIFMFLMMIMFGGIAVDVMRFETRRVAMQQTMDRAALAAASLTQTRSPTAIANDWFQKAGLGEELVMVDFTDPTVTAFADAGLRRVTITSRVRSENFFMTILSDNEYLEGPTNT